MVSENHEDSSGDNVSVHVGVATPLVPALVTTHGPVTLVSTKLIVVLILRTRRDNSGRSGSVWTKGRLSIPSTT